MRTDTVMMGCDIFDYLTAHPKEEFPERKRLLIQHLEDMELQDAASEPAVEQDLDCIAAPGLHLPLTDAARNVARHLWGSKRTADMLLNGGCEPYPEWGDLSESARSKWESFAPRIITGMEAA